MKTQEQIIKTSVAFQQREQVKMPKRRYCLQAVYAPAPIIGNVRSRHHAGICWFSVIMIDTISMYGCIAPELNRLHFLPSA
jgi:hypothetical protein